jgi:uncharacterized protein YndB with AHSA1/START domain
MAKYIKHDFFYPTTPDVVWEYLTVPELIAQWLMKTDFKPVVGHEFQFRTNPHPDVDFDGVFYCKVLEVEPLKKLSYSWKFGSGNGILHDSVVNWTLIEKADGTELQLIHNGFEKEAHLLPMFASMETGWLRNITKILHLINAATHGTARA